MLRNQNHLRGFHQTLQVSSISPLHHPQMSGQKSKSCEALCSWIRVYYCLQRRRYLLFIPKQRAELSHLSCQKSVNLHKTLFRSCVVCHLIPQICDSLVFNGLLTSFLFKISKSFQGYGGYYSKAYIIDITYYLEILKYTSISDYIKSHNHKRRMQVGQFDLVKFFRPHCI